VGAVCSVVHKVFISREIITVVCMAGDSKALCKEGVDYMYADH